MEELIGDLEARSDPLDLGLADDSPVGVGLEALLASILPVYNASLTLTAGCWSSASRDTTVIALPSGAPCPPGHRCVQAFPVDADDPDARLARYLAWPLTHGLLVRLASVEQARALVEAVRARVGSSDTIALALDRDTQQRLGPTELLRLQQKCRTAASLLSRAGGKLDPLLVGLASDDRAPLVPWLHLDPADVLIVPRQGALARRAAFLAEADAELAHVQVVQRLDAQTHSHG